MVSHPAHNVRNDLATLYANIRKWEEKKAKFCGFFYFCGKIGILMSKKIEISTDILGETNVKAVAKEVMRWALDNLRDESGFLNEEQNIRIYFGRNGIEHTIKEKMSKPHKKWQYSPEFLATVFKLKELVENSTLESTEKEKNGKKEIVKIWNFTHQITIDQLDYEVDITIKETIISEGEPTKHIFYNHQFKEKGSDKSEPL